MRAAPKLRAPLRPTRARVIAVVVAAPWILWAVLRTLGLEHGHPLVALVAFTPYAAALSPLPVLVALLLRRRVVTAVAAVAALALLAAMLPRAVPGPARARADASGRPLVVMSANLRFGHGDPAAVLRLVREHDVDVLSLQELTPDALRGLDAAGLAKFLPQRAVRPDTGWSGLGVLARAPLRAVAPRGPHSETRLEVALSPRGGPACGSSPCTRCRPSRKPTRAWVAALRALPGPRAGAVARVLAGDFNATLDHREMHRLLARGYADAADAMGAGLRPTWPTTGGRPPLTIDHVRVARPILVRRVSLHAVPGSDHRALIAELVPA